MEATLAHTWMLQFLARLSMWINTNLKLDKLSYALLVFEFKALQILFIQNIYNMEFSQSMVYIYNCLHMYMHMYISYVCI